MKYCTFKETKNSFIYEYGSWKGYICDKKPFYDGGTEVTTFNDFID